MEDDQNERRPRWKMTKMEDDQNGRKPKCFSYFFGSDFRNDDLAQLSSAKHNLNSAYPELGTAQPQIFFIYYYLKSFFYKS